MSSEEAGSPLNRSNPLNGRTPRFNERQKREMDKFLSDTLETLGNHPPQDAFRADHEHLFKDGTRCCTYLTTWHKSQAECDKEVERLRAEPYIHFNFCRLEQNLCKEEGKRMHQVWEQSYTEKLEHLDSPMNMLKTITVPNALCYLSQRMNVFSNDALESTESREQHITRLIHAADRMMVGCSKKIEGHLISAKLMGEEIEVKQFCIEKLQQSIVELRAEVATLREQQLRANPPLLPPEPPVVTAAEVKREDKSRATRSANKANKAKLVAEMEEQQRFAEAEAFKREKLKKKKQAQARKKIEQSV